MILQEYEDFKQKYRNLNPRIIERRLVKSGYKDIEEYIQYVLETIHEWPTLEDYAYDRYKVARFEGNKAIALYNP